ncbi:hypothetical protein CN984_12525 [Bacillus cereus]|uniref:Uncharacterized protein n=1 Tax=Bacillus cereus TaxID=1396 RepID=A0A2B9Q2W4_BACCE|nr:hypothetical protein [Bacillus cereus]PGO29243.1 hypothetical protein CN984_12525 [Bacillus cereus]
MKKFMKLVMAVMVMAMSVGMFATPTHEVEAESNYKEQAQKNITVIHTIVERVEDGLAYTLPIDDNDAIEDYILVEAKNYEQGAIVTVTMDGLGEIVKDEYTLNEELSTLYKRFGDVIDSYEESFGAKIETKIINIELEDGEWAYGSDAEGYEYAVSSDRVEVGQVAQVTVNEFGEVFTVDVLKSI